MLNRGPFVFVKTLGEGLWLWTGREAGIEPQFEVKMRTTTVYNGLSSTRKPTKLPVVTMMSTNDPNFCLRRAEYANAEWDARC